MTAQSTRKQRQTTSERIDPARPASRVINRRFSGLSHFCRETGYPTSTAHGWLVNGYIPQVRKGEAVHTKIMADAARSGVDLSLSDFLDQPDG